MIAIQVERALEIALLVAVAWPLMRLSADPGVRRRFEAFPNMRVMMLGSLGMYGCGIAALAVIWPELLRPTAAVSVAFLVILKWQSRPSHGRRQGYPAGSLAFIPIKPWRDPEYYLKQSIIHGSVFKFRHFARPAIGIVGLEQAASFLRENHDNLLVPPAPFNSIVPGGFVRYLGGSRHQNVSGVLRSAINQSVIDSCEPQFTLEARMALGSLAAAGETGKDPAPVIDAMVLHDLMLCFFGVAAGPVLDRLSALYKLGDYRRLSRAGRKRAAAAVFEIVREVRQLANQMQEDLAGHDKSPSFLSRIVRLHPDAIADDETMGNFVYALHTARLDAAGLLVWLLVTMGENPSWVVKLANEAAQIDDASSQANSLADRMVRETLRLHQSEFLMRRVTRPIQWNGYRIPKGWHVRICVQESHRDPGLFEQPNTFDPDRFLSRPRRASYAPFGMAPRLCPGEHLARSLGSNLAIELATLYEIHLHNDRPVEFSGFHWRPNSGLRTSLLHRS